MSTAYAVVRCPFVCSSVCLSRSCIVSSTVSLLSIINVCFLLSTMLMNKDYHIIFLNIFYRRVGLPFYFFPTKPRGNIPTEASNADGTKNRDFRPISGFITMER